MTAGQVTKHDRYCYINPSRGYGNTRWEIVEHGKEELTLRDPITQGKFLIYTAHCYTDLETKQASLRERRAAANTIGRPKVKPDKRP